MTKRVLILLLAAFLLLTGCGFFGDSEETPEPRPRMPARGVWNDNVFTNEYLGLQFEMPSDWTASTDLDVRALSDADIFGTIASSPDSNTSVHILFRRLNVLILGMNESDYMASVAEQAGVSFEPHGMRRIGRYNWHSYQTVAGGNHYGHYFINIDNGFVRVISLLYNDQSKSLEELLDMFSPL